ncbi:COG0816 Predicted endonuclease involved in recombination (possible Holliday junction resolvase in Mycoplasmas and B. subtilis) [Candidatus Nanopelagicaceae bacterium]
MVRGRRIAFDYGDSRIGVAICDPDGILASPLPFLDARHPKLSQMLKELFAEYEPILIFLGLPKHLSGEDGEAVSKVKDFAAQLSMLTEIEIAYVDERLSTVDAQRKLREAGKNSKESKLLVDSMAAVAILESGLAREAR